MKERMRLWLRRALILAAVILVLSPLVAFLLPRLSVGTSETPNVDAIFLLSFDPRLKTTEYAAALYRQGVAKKVAAVSNAMTCDIFPSDYAQRYLVSLGVAEADALVMHTPDTDCRAQLFAPTLQYAQQQGWRRILWVVDPAGSRMARYRLQPKFKAAGIEMFVTYPSAAGQELKEGWWHSHWKVQRLAYDVIESSLDLFYSECW